MSYRPPQEQIDRLPKWAQRYISVLEGNLKDAGDKLSAGPENSNVFADIYDDSPRPLGRDTRIEYLLSGGRSFIVQPRKNILKIMMNHPGVDRMVVMPEISNVVAITSMERDLS